MPRTPLKVYIVGQVQRPYARMFLERSDRTFIGTRNLKEADIVVFTGGADINPRLYGEKPLSVTSFSEARDEIDLDAWTATPDNVISVGICRGAQFLNVMNGGTLWQDISDHTFSHLITDRMTGRSIWASSTHHQQMIPGPDAHVVAVAAKAKEKHAFGRSYERSLSESQDRRILFEDGDAVDYEVLEYPDTLTLCFQPHPEHLNAGLDCRHYFFQRLEVMLSLRARKLKNASKTQ